MLCFFTLAAGLLLLIYFSAFMLFVFTRTFYTFCCCFLCLSLTAELFFYVMFCTQLCLQLTLFFIFFLIFTFSLSMFYLLYFFCIVFQWMFVSARYFSKHSLLSLIHFVSLFHNIQNLTYFLFVSFLSRSFSFTLN